MLFDHFWGLSYHSLPHAAEAKADQALERFTDSLHAGIILTDRVCQKDSRDQGFPKLQTCPRDRAGLFCYTCASASLLWDTALCPRLDPLMENEKHESFVYLNKSLWPFMRGHSFEFRATVFSEAGTLRKAPIDTRGLGVTVCSPVNCACVNLFPHCSGDSAVLYHGSTSSEKLWKSSLPKAKLTLQHNNRGRCLSQLLLTEPPGQACCALTRQVLVQEFASSPLLHFHLKN